MDVGEGLLYHVVCKCLLLLQFPAMVSLLVTRLYSIRAQKEEVETQVHTFVVKKSDFSFETKHKFHYVTL